MNSEQHADHTNHMTDKHQSRDNQAETIEITPVRRENQLGIEKDHFDVYAGTTKFTVPKRVKNPTTGKYQDLTQLSQGGYCLLFLAVWSYLQRDTVTDLSGSNVLTFDKSKWDFEETDGHYVVRSTEGDDAE